MPVRASMSTGGALNVPGTGPSSSSGGESLSVGGGTPASSPSDSGGFVPNPSAPSGSVSDGDVSYPGDSPNCETGAIDGFAPRVDPNADPPNQSWQPPAVPGVTALVPARTTKLRFTDYVVAGTPIIMVGSTAVFQLFGDQPYLWTDATKFEQDEAFEVFLNGVSLSKTDEMTWISSTTISLDNYDFEPGDELTLISVNPP